MFVQHNLRIARIKQRRNSELEVPGTMTGRGRSGYGRNAYRGGRGQGRGAGRSSKPNQDNNKTSSSTTTELKFAPHYSGKQHMTMYDTVKDHIVIIVQKTYKHGNDIAKALRDEADLADVGAGPPA